MINRGEILQTIEMIDQQHLDVRTVTMGISLLDCCDPDPKAACRKIYDKITRSAKDLVKTDVYKRQILYMPRRLWSSFGCCLRCSVS